MEYAIRVENLAKQYQIGEQHENMLRDLLVNLVKRPFRKARSSKQSIWALKDVSFTIEQGEVVGVIGRNGAGKSTLLKLLSKITYPTSGKISLRGRVAALLEVGTGFHEELTGRENIYLNGSILGLKKKEINQRMPEIIAFSGVEKFIDTPIKRYSSGMRLRLGFAVAAYLEPDILLVDEVLAVGDVEFQKKCLNAMDDLRNSGRTVIFISHNMTAIENLCPRTIWVDNGKIQKDGDTREVIAAYLSTFTEASGCQYNFEEIEYRTGSGKVKFTSLQFLDSGKNSREVIRCGDSLLIRLHYKANEAVLNPYFGVKIHTDLGTLISDINTWHSKFEIPSLLAGSGSIEMNLDSLNLVPGRYYISLWLTDVKEWYDVLDHCAILDVEPSNIYRSGFENRFGLVLYPCQWQLNQ